MDKWYSEIFEDYLGFWEENKLNIQEHHKKIKRLERKVIK